MNIKCKTAIYKNMFIVSNVCTKMYKAIQAWDNPLDILIINNFKLKIYLIKLYTVKSLHKFHYGSVLLLICIV